MHILRNHHMMNILESSNLGGYKEVINEVEHQRALMMDIHDLVLPILDPYSGQAKLVRQLFEDAFSCSSKIISSLEIGDNSEKQDILTKYKRKGYENIMENHILEENKGRGNKRRKNANSVVTQAPYFDGYQWRKYGQKWISKAKHSRSYYRCAYSKEQGCPATKTVQQKESDGNGMVRLFDVDYYGQHICNSDGIVHPYVVEATTHDSVPIASQNQISSSTFVNTTDAHGVHDESFESLFMVPDMPEYLTELTDIEMARAFEITYMNSPLIPEDIWV